jgi:hypothetical protein
MQVFGKGGLKMKRQIKRIAKVTGLAAISAAVASATAYGTTKYFVNLAMDREKPKSAEKAGRFISGSQGENPFQEARRAAAAKLAEKDSETIELTSHDGITLFGHWIPQDNAKRVIIAMHGWRSSWNQDFGLIADFWEENGCSVLYAEQRGQNNSGGEYMGFGLMERYDCLDWIHWVSERCGSQIPIYLAGISMGATTVLMAAGLDLPPQVHGIAADCGFTSLHDIWKHVANKNLHIAYGIRGRVADELCKKKIQVGTEEYSTTTALENNQIPVMLIHGTEDHFVPIEMTYANYEACKGPKKLLIVPGADHCMSYCLEKERYENAVKDFWKQYDA